ncbi:hypothetical protein BH23GEM9_BH23GEM9_03550 [soil metagenome]
MQTAGGEVLEGPFRLAADSILLESAVTRRAIALGDVRSVWYQQRETRSGALAGALVGGAAGGAFLGLLAFVAGGSGSETATLIAVGVLGGGAAGGLLGGVVGAAVPRWTLVHPTGTELPTVAPAVTERGETRVGRRRLGAVDGAIGYGRVGGDEPTGGGVGGRVALHAEFGVEPRPGSTAVFLTVGPEIGHFKLGSTGLLRRTLPPTDTLELSRSYTASAAGGVLRAGMDAHAWRGYGLVGLAYHRWEIEDRDERWIHRSPDRVLVSGQSRFEHLGYIIGGGGQARLAPRTAAGLELRHTAVGTFDMDLPGGYWTLTMTATHRW